MNPPLAPPLEGNISYLHSLVRKKYAICSLSKEANICYLHFLEGDESERFLLSYCRIGKYMVFVSTIGVESVLL